MLRPALPLVLVALAGAVPLADALVSDALANPPEGGWSTQVHVQAAPAAAARTSLPGARPPAAGKRAVKPHALDGIASFYWQSQMTASGEVFDKRAMTAAHPTLPFGTLVEVTNLRNGKTTVVRINDRGPFKPGRIIDVSEAAAEVLDMQARGLVPVRLEIVAAANDR